MAVTPFLKLQKPPFDTIPWDEAVNGNMDTIDAFISRYMAVPNYVGAWVNSTNYISGQNVLDITNATIYLCQVTHVSSAIPATFSQDRTTYPTYWAATTNVASGSVGLSITEVAPLSSKAGDLWWNSAEGQLYILYNDGNSLQWVVANNQAGNIGDAPRDGNIYGRQMGAWVGSVNSQDVGRNKLHNGLFTVAQRGAGPWTASPSNTADRWLMGFVGGSLSTTINAMNDTNRAQIGDEAATQSLVGACVGGAGASDETYFEQRMEGVRRTAGKTAILSFYALAASGAPKVGIMLYQMFGSGGSPSVVVAIAGQTVTLSTTYTRYSLTFSIPSVAGKTFGTTAGTDYLGVRLVMSAGATTGASYGNPGVQSGTFVFWGVQLEIAAPGQTQPSPLEKLDPRMELSNCQRFYYAGPLWTTGYAGTGSTTGTGVPFPVSMRTTPTVVVTSPAYTNASGGTLNAVGGALVAVQFVVTATGTGYFSGTFTASADL